MEFFINELSLHGQFSSIYAFEVFENPNHHLGKADLEGKIDYNKRDKNKKIRKYQ